MGEIWQALEEKATAVAQRKIVTLFEDETRFDAFSAEADGLLLDYSKTNLDAQARALLARLLEERGVAKRREMMFAGAKINETEGRAVLHTALRSAATEPLIVDGADVRPAIATTLARMAAFARDVRSGALKGATGQSFTDVVNIGIGGSDLGPAMATLALAPYHDGPRCHYLSNIDGAHAHDILKSLDPARTLVIIASKTFTTIETMTNAQTVLSWLRRALGTEIGAHLAAVSTALDLTAKMGIAPERVFGFADWVGGRYSLWGPVGLPVMIAIGPEHFARFLAGGAAMDAHFQSAPPEENLPMLLAMIGLWHRNFCGYPTRALLPYDQRLSRLAAYVQQLDMESNGKSVALEGAELALATGPVVWGEPGTNGQHAFYQLLHQGTDVIPAEFLIAARGHEPELAHHHDLLKANCLAQSEALMLGRTHADPQRSFAGNRPSVTLAYDQLTPFVLGQIIALYEHRVFVEGAVWGINSYDQWGVELGKELANTLLPMVQGAPSESKDASTRGLLAKLGAR